MIGIEAARGNAKTYGAEPLLLFASHAEMIGMCRTAHISTLKRQFMPQAFNEFRAQTRYAPLFDEKSQAALRARSPRAVIAIDFYQLHHQRRGLKSLHENIQRRSNGESSR